MQILYSPQRSDIKLRYEFEQDIVKAYMDLPVEEIDGEEIITSIQEVEEIFDFTEVPDGVLEEVETSFPVNPIVSAKRVDGELFVELLYFHSANASQGELFPQWYDPLYVEPVVEEDLFIDGEVIDNEG